MIPLLKKLRELQQWIREEGLGGSMLSLPAPKLLLLPDPTSIDAKEELLFTQIVTEEENVAVCRDLFESGFYNQAVVEAFKALDIFIKKKAKATKVSGATLMNLVFSPSNPKLAWSERQSTSEEDEQKGYHFLFSGSFTGIRNPCTHEINWISDHETALDAILLAQHLLRKAKAANPLGDI